MKENLAKASVEYRQNYIESLRREIVSTVEREVSPLAIKYKYADTPLEENIKWRPLVLLLGNYSSGKSTLINEFLERDIQTIGQAPTDDSFTVISYKENSDDIEERDGRVLLNDPQYPFACLKKHGQRFAAHFRLKLVPSPFLKNLAIIDTPGMLDSVAERDRGYDYQQVIGDLAGIADLILVLFDPHKAGTIRETYESLRRTLPRSTYEDRVLFVLNRVDECTNLNDLLRVYGTLCWNLSQMTGRKDIPLISMTYSERYQSASHPDFLNLLENQRQSLKQSILQAPRHRLDHLATYVEEHGERLTHLLEALLNYAKRRRAFFVKISILGAFASLLVGGLSYWFMHQAGMADAVPLALLPALGGGVAVGAFSLWMLFVNPVLLKAQHANILMHLDELTPLDWQSRMESWQTIKPVVERNLKKRAGRTRLGEIKADLRRVKNAVERSSRETRKGLSELAVSG